MDVAGSIPEQASFYQYLIVLSNIHYFVVGVLGRQGYHLVIRSKANTIPFFVSILIILFVNWEDKASSKFKTLLGRQGVIFVFE